MHSLLLTNTWHVFMKYWCLPWRNRRIPNAPNSLAANAPRKVYHILFGGLQGHSAWEPALSCEVLMWVLGTASSLWTAAQASYSVGFIWLPEDLSCAGGLSGCASKAQDFLLGEKTSCAGLWLKTIPESGYKCTQWNWVLPSPDRHTCHCVSLDLHTGNFSPMVALF